MRPPRNLCHMKRIVVNAKKNLSTEDTEKDEGAENRKQNRRYLCVIRADVVKFNMAS